MKALKFTLLWAMLFSLTSLSAQQMPIPDFSWSPQPACAGQPVQFTDQSTNVIAPAYWLYGFGDGTPTSFSSQNPVHTYTNAGTYNVYFCVFDSIWGDTFCITKPVVVQAGPCTTPDTVQGTVYYDFNNNGSYDPLNDYPLQNILVDIGGFQFATDSSGQYTAIINAGTYTASIPNPAPYTVSTPTGGTHSLMLPGSGQTFTADFGLTAPMAVQDLGISLFTSRFRPGFQAYLLARVTNFGTFPTSGTVTVTYHDSLNYLNSTPIGTHNATNRTVDFTFSNLPPTQTTVFRVNGQVPTTVPLGTAITTHAMVGPLANDAVPANNTTAFTDTVTGSYDPNDKAVSPSFGPEGYVKPDQQLTYRIRFQNTGTDTAFTVAVIDTLSDHLDLSTFQMMDASHSYRYYIDDNRAIHWTFDNILLPDSNTNEAESHGHIIFNISPVAGLADFTEITNFVDIYFDFNTPIRTNTTLTTINSATSLTPPAFSSLQTGPNPTRDRFQLRFENPSGQLHSLRLLDVQGKLIAQQASRGEHMELSLEKQPAGIYLYELQAEDGRRQVGKVVKK